MLTRVYFRRKDLEGVTHKDTRAREMVEVCVCLCVGVCVCVCGVCVCVCVCVCVEALFFGPVGPLYKTQVLQRNFVRRKEEWLRSWYPI